MKILAIWDGMGGSAYHRLYTPLKRLTIDHNIHVDISQQFVKNGLPNLKQYDLVMFNGWLGDSHYDILEYMARHRIPYIIDVDDYWVLNKAHPEYKKWRSSKIKAAMIDAIRYANGVTCTTELLAAQIRPINQSVCIIPNALDLTEPQWLATKRPSDAFTFGWVGGTTHSNDIQIISEAIMAMINNHGQKVQFVIAGWRAGNYIWDSILFKFNGGIAGKVHPQITVIPATSANDYGNAYSLFDCALAPLEATKFNSCKSELKMIEAAAYNLPIVASDVPPYNEHRENKGLILTGNTTKEWVAAMERAMKTDGRLNAEYCSRYNLDKLNYKRLDFINCKSVAQPKE